MVVLGALVVAAWFVTSVPPALAEPGAPLPVAGRVQVLQSNPIAPRARRCLNRIREELTAGGFVVVNNEFAADSDALWTLDPPGVHDALATITLLGDPEAGAAELWIVNGPVAGRGAVRRLVLPAGAGTHEEEVLAVRTLEFLRASALELALTPAPASAPAPVSVAAAAPPTSVSPNVSPQAAPPPGSPFSAEMGLCVLEGSPSLGPAFLPLLRFRAEVVGPLEARLSLAGFGSSSRLWDKNGKNGSAAVNQSFGLLELRAVFRRGHLVRPSVGAGVGALLVRTEGTGNWPYEGRRGQTTTALFDLGAGVTVALSARFALAAEAHAELAAPYPEIAFSGVEADRLGRPALLGTLSLVARL